MKDQRVREEQAVTIATSVAVFVAVLGAGIAVLLLIGRVGDMGRTFAAGFVWAVVAGGLAGGLYLVRHRR